MQVFKMFLKITKKNIPMALIYVGIFIVLAVLISTSMSDEDSFMESRLDISVIDKDQTAASQALIDYISTKHNLVEVEDNKKKMLDALYYTTTDYILTIESGYEEKLKKNETDDLFYNYQVHHSYAGTLFELDLDEYIRTLTSYLVGENGCKDALDKTSEQMGTELIVDTVSFEKEVSYQKNFEKETASYFHYLPYIFLVLLITLLCPVLTTIYAKEFRDRTNCSSISISKLNTQIFLGSGVLITAIWIIFMIVGVFINGGIFTGNAWIAVLNSFVFIMVSAGIAILLSIFSPSKQIMNVMANVVSLGMCFLCGVFVSQSLLGDNVLKFTRFLPAYWYMRVNDMMTGVSSDSFSITKCMQCIGIEATFVIALFADVLLINKLKQKAKV